jgi:1-acyl-sn-glycerol-3-phosphate acyltransferase
MTWIFSIFYWLFLAATSIVLYPIAVLIWLATMLFDPCRRFLHSYTCLWAQLYVRCLPGCRIRVEGRERIQPGVPYVLVANHQSMADIMALSALGVLFKWVSKKEAFRIPLIGWNMYLNQYVCVDRGNVRNVRATMDTCQSWLDLGVPLMMFPEGHRSPDGEIHEFHGGAFKLAVDSRVAVVPIVVDGTWQIYRGMRVNPFPGTITIRVLEPIPSGDNASPLRDEVFTRMQAELAAIRGLEAKRPAVREVG